MSEEEQTGFIETRLVSFKEGIISALLLQLPRKMKYSWQIGTTRENAVNSQLARLEVPLYIQSVISIYIYTRKITYIIGDGTQVSRVATRVIPL